MGSEVIILTVIFGLIFGIAYRYFSTRNKERLALIEKGADASIFVPGNRNGGSSVGEIALLDLALLPMAIGLAIFIASFMEVQMGMDGGVAFPGTIFLFAGLGLLVGFGQTKRLDRK